MWKMINRELSTNISIYKNFRGLVIVLCAIIYPFLIGSDNMSAFNYFIMLGGLTSVAFTEGESRDKVYISILSSPCKRSDYVFGKFLGNLIWIGILTVIGLILNGILNVMMPERCLPATLGQVKLVVSYMLIFTGIYYLLYFALGLKWAKIGYFVVFFAIMVGVVGMEDIIFGSNSPHVIRQLYSFIDSADLLNNLILLIIVGALLGLFAYVSYIFYDKKDF